MLLDLRKWSIIYLLLCFTVGSINAETFDKLVIEVDHKSQRVLANMPLASDSIFEIMIRVRNTDSVDHTLVINHKIDKYRRYYYNTDGAKLELTRRDVIKANSEIEFIYSLPLSTNFYNKDSIEIVIDGKVQDEKKVEACLGHFLNLSVPNSGYYGHNDNKFHILSTSHAEWMDDLVRTSSSASYYELELKKCDITDINSIISFKSIFSYLMVYLNQESLDKLKPETKDKLLNYVKLGGVLVVDGKKFEVPTGAQLQKTASWGDVHAYGFGQLLRVTKFTNAGNYANDRESTYKYFEKYFRNLDLTMNGNNYNFRFGKDSSGFTNFIHQILSGYNNPLGIILTICILLPILSILIGPVLLFILHRRKKRIHFTWLTPLLSLTASIFIIILITIIEDSRPLVVSRSITILNQLENEAYSAGGVAVYGEQGIKGGIKFDEDSLVHFDYDRNINVDHSNGWYFSESSFTPRVPFPFKIRKIIPNRKRLQFYQLGLDKMRVVNGLGVDLGYLHFTGPDGNYYLYNKPIKAGESVEINIEKKGRRSQSLVYSDELASSVIRKKSSSAKSYYSFDYIKKRSLPKNSYFTKIIGHNPFLEPFTETTSRKHDNAYVYGIFEVTK